MVRKRLHGVRRTLDARPDELDPRDHWFAGAATHIPAARPLAEYLRGAPPVLDQGAGGGSVGFALATVANYLLRSTRSSREEPVSPWMLQAMAGRYDPWSRHSDAGVEARSALKGWYAHGVCRDALWNRPVQDSEPTLTPARAEDAALRPLARYRRVTAQRLADMQAALAQNGILLATAWIHEGWFQPRADGTIVPSPERVGCHAMALVGYDQDGFWIHNAWGSGWARRGFGYLGYDDWLLHGSDAWTVQLAAPVRLPLATHHRHASRLTECPALYSELRGHVVCLDDDGRLRQTGAYGNSKGDVEAILRNDFARVTATWSRKRLLVLAPHRLSGEEAALSQVRNALPSCLSRQVYPLTLLWPRDLSSQLNALLRNAAGLAESVQGSREDLLERRIRENGGDRLWQALKRGALAASASPIGALRLLAGHIAHLFAEDPVVELHAWAHGAGALLLGPFIELLTTPGQVRGGGLAGANGLGLPIRSCGLAAPACTPAAFQENYATALASGGLRHLTLLQWSRSAVGSESAIAGYRRPFLQLVANALEDQPRIPGVRDGTPVLGLESAPMAEGIQRFLASRRLTLGLLDADAGEDPECVLAHLTGLEPIGVAEPAVLGIAEPVRRYANRFRRR